MNRFGSAINRLFQLGLMLSMLTLVALPAMALQGGGGGEGGGGTGTDVSVSTSETTTTSSWITDWGIWAIVGAVVLIALIIALTRGRGGDSTTVVK
jgi:hypothetical protein